MMIFAAPFASERKTVITDKLQIRHSFSDSERLALGEEQCKALGKLDELEAHLKAVATMIKAEIEGQKAAIRVVSSKLNSKYEMRDIQCAICDHRIPGCRLVVRLDTGHVVKRRKLEPHEMQIKLTDEAPPPYVAIALLQVDDESVKDVDAIEIHVYEDEYDALRALPDVRMRSVPKAIAGDTPKPKDKKK